MFPSFLGLKKMFEIYSSLSWVSTFSMISAFKNLSISALILTWSASLNVNGLGIDVWNGKLSNSTL